MIVFSDVVRYYAVYLFIKMLLLVMLYIRITDCFLDNTFL